MKIEEQVLSIEQMKHLQELGVDTSDASMVYYNISRGNQPDKWILGIANKGVASIMLSNGITEMKPAYTIGDLIEKLPEVISNHRLLIDLDAQIAYYKDWFSDIAGRGCPTKFWVNKRRNRVIIRENKHVFRRL